MQLVAHLRGEFPQIDVCTQLGRFRARQRRLARLQQLESHDAPPEVLAHARQRLDDGQRDMLQATLYLDDPPRAALDLTLSPEEVRIYYDPYDQAAAERCAQVLGGAPLDESKTHALDERASEEEYDYWSRVHETRQRMHSELGTFEGRPAIFQSETKVSRVMVHDLTVNARRFMARLTLVPTPGLWNELTMRGVSWRWDEFSCTSIGWFRGPDVVEKFHFGPQVDAVVAYCQSLNEPSYSPSRRREIIAELSRYRDSTGAADEFLSDAATEPHDVDQYFLMVYDDLRRQATKLLAREQPGQTLQTTALVHEAYLRLATGTLATTKSHFFRIAALAMRRILVDHARKKYSAKRGGGRQQFEISESDQVFLPNSETLLAIDESLTRLAAEDPQSAEIARFRLFTGLSIEEAGNLLGISRAAAYRQWEFARAVLTADLRSGEDEIDE